MKKFYDKLRSAEKKLLAAVIESEKERYQAGEKSREAASTALTAIRQCMLALEEESGTVDVARVLHEQKTAPGPGTRQEIHERHESFGVVSVSRVTGSTRLVGAFTDALPNFVELKVYRSKRIIDPELHTERYYPERGPLVSVRMSLYQWAELITNLNVGLGQPCTLSSVMSVQMEPVPEAVTTPFEQLVQDSKNRVGDATGAEKEFLASVHAVKSAIDASGLSKKKSEEILKKLSAVADQVQAPKRAQEWAATRLGEVIETSVSQAKIEIAASLTSMVERAGLDSLRQQLKADADSVKLFESRESKIQTDS